MVQERVARGVSGIDSVDNDYEEMGIPEASKGHSRSAEGSKERLVDGEGGVQKMGVGSSKLKSKESDVK